MLIFSDGKPPNVHRSPGGGNASPPSIFMRCRTNLCNVTLYELRGPYSAVGWLFITRPLTKKAGVSPFSLNIKSKVKKTPDRPKTDRCFAPEMCLEVVKALCRRIRHHPLFTNG